MTKLTKESITFPLHSTQSLYLARFYKDTSGPPVLMLHGAIENGRIFYSNSHKGLAPYLAEQGYDVFVADLRGRGKSVPCIDKHARYGQTEAITEDIPAFINKIIEYKGEVPQYWVAHSWGGVLLSAYLARFSEHRSLVKAMVYFGAKRRITVKNFTCFLEVNLFWHTIAPLLTASIGYLPARQLHVGSDNETRLSHRHSQHWVRETRWVDVQDGFDYGQALKQFDLPPTLYLAAINDRCLGHPKDVALFMKECDSSNAHYRVLAKSNANLVDYDHITMLTHPRARYDHFPLLLHWFENNP